MRSTGNDRRALIIGAGVAGPILAMALQRAGIESAVFEGRQRETVEGGAWLALAPNGVNALETLDVDIEREADGFKATGMAFFNGAGKPVGFVDSRPEQARYGARSIVLERGRLADALRAAALRRGIAIEFGKRLAGIEVNDPREVVARFEDGTTSRGDFLIGCDGIQSRTRRLILPDGPRPTFTGLIDTGGFARCPGLASSGAIHMTFGKRAFFGHLVKPNGEVYWFSNVPWSDEPARGELQAISDDAWRARLLDLHGQNPSPIPEIIHATRGEIGKWPSYDIPFLPTWHRGRVCLVGDAAHATTPHAGQGASMAIEDALVLARILRDVPDLEAAFATYERLRKARVERVTRMARRTGQRKTVANPLAGWVRDLMLPFFIKLGASSMDWVYEYRVDWEQPAT